MGVLTNLRSEVRNFIRAWQDPDKLPNEFPGKNNLLWYFQNSSDEPPTRSIRFWEGKTEDSWKEMKDFFLKKCGGIQADYLECVLRKLVAEEKIIIEERDFFYRDPDG